MREATQRVCPDVTPDAEKVAGGPGPAPGGPSVTDTILVLQALGGNGSGSTMSGRRSEAARLASELSVRAFTSGNDIFFNDGAYEPSTSDGYRVLAASTIHHSFYYAISCAPLTGAIAGLAMAILGNVNVAERVNQHDDFSIASEVTHSRQEPGERRRAAQRAAQW